MHCLYNDARDHRPAECRQPHHQHSSKLHACVIGAWLLKKVDWNLLTRCRFLPPSPLRPFIAVVICARQQFVWASPTSSHIKCQTLKSVPLQTVSCDPGRLLVGPGGFEAVRMVCVGRGSYSSSNELQTDGPIHPVYGDQNKKWWHMPARECAVQLSHSEKFTGRLINACLWKCVGSMTAGFGFPDVELCHVDTRPG